MAKKIDTPALTDASTIDIDIEQFKSYTQETWYNLFVVMFLKMNNKEIADCADSIVEAVCDAMDISTIKHYYEDNDRTLESEVIND